jgi:Type II secretion system (T2SS), protein M
MNLRPRDRAALGVVLVAVMIGAFYMLLLKPEQHKAATLDTAIAGQQAKLVQEQRAVAAGRQAQAQLRAEAAQWAALRRAVPNQSNIPALLDLLERNANAVHVNMQAISLSGSGGSSTASPSTTTTSTGGSSSASGSHAATGVPVQLTFAGGYAALNKLVHRLDSLVVFSGNSVHATGPLMTISNVSLTGAPKLSVQLNATIYQLSAATSAAGGTTGG